jgi:hypothetical protein
MNLPENIENIYVTGSRISEKPDGKGFSWQCGQNQVYMVNRQEQLLVHHKEL